MFLENRKVFSVEISEPNWWKTFGRTGRSGPPSAPGSRGFSLSSLKDDPTLSFRCPYPQIMIWVWIRVITMLAFDRIVVMHTYLYPDP